MAPPSHHRIRTGRRVSRVPPLTPAGPARGAPDCTSGHGRDDDRMSRDDVVATSGGRAAVQRRAVRARTVSGASDGHVHAPEEWPTPGGSASHPEFKRLACGGRPGEDGGPRSVPGKETRCLYPLKRRVTA